MGPNYIQQYFKYSYTVYSINQLSTFCPNLANLFFLIMSDYTCLISLQNVSNLRLHISYEFSIKFGTTTRFRVLFALWKWKIPFFTAKFLAGSFHLLQISCSHPYFPQFTVWWTRNFAARNFAVRRWNFIGCNIS